MFSIESFSQSMPMNAIMSISSHIFCTSVDMCACLIVYASIHMRPTPMLDRTFTAQVLDLTDNDRLFTLQISDSIETTTEKSSNSKDNNNNTNNTAHTDCDNGPTLVLERTEQRNVPSFAISKKPT